MVSTRVLLAILKEAAQSGSLYRVSSSLYHSSSTPLPCYTGLPEHVVGLTTSPSDTSISLTWSFRSDWQRDSILLQLTRSGVLEDSMMLGGDMTSTTFSSLSPLTNYTITVYVEDSVGRSEPVTSLTSTLSLSKYLYILHHH